MRKKRSFSEWLLYKMQKANEQAKRRTPAESLEELVKAGIMNPDGSFTEHYPNLGAILDSRS